MSQEQPPAPPGPGWWLASDGRWYPPQPQSPGPPPGPPSPPPRQGLHGCVLPLVALGVVAVLSIVAIAVVVVRASDEVDDRVTERDGITSFSGNSENPPQDDVSLRSCATGLEPGRRPTAGGDIVNRSSKTSTYIISVEFEGTDGQSVSTSTDFGTTVEPGQTQAWSAMADDEWTAPVRCRLVGVQRFATRE